MAGGPVLVVVQLKPHAVMDFVVSQSDMIFVNSVPLLDTNLVWTRAGLSGDKLLQVTNGIVFAARRPPVRLRCHTAQQPSIQAVFPLLTCT